MRTAEQFALLDLPEGSQQHALLDLRIEILKASRGGLFELAFNNWYVRLEKHATDIALLTDNLSA
jgi:hypothetical protein